MRSIGERTLISIFLSFLIGLIVLLFNGRNISSAIIPALSFSLLVSIIVAVLSLLVGKMERLNIGSKPSNDKLEPISGQEKRIRVLIADDHPLMDTRLKSELNAEYDLLLVGEATNSEEIQIMCDAYQPDVLLLNLDMPGPSAMEIIAKLRQCFPETRVLILTSCADQEYARGLVNAGVTGYLLKEESPQVVAQAIHAAMQGGAWFSQRVAEKLAQPTNLPALTQREQDILRSIAQGKTDQQIGLDLGLSERTIRYDLQRIYEKLGVTTRVEAAVQATKRGLNRIRLCRRYRTPTKWFSR
jgi:DNA-binding NarL/FixJ family response regulator